MRRRKKKKLIENKALMAIFFSFIMVSSILSIIFGGYNAPQDNELEYEGYTFTRGENFWTVEVNGSLYKTHFFPTELSDLNVSPEITARIKSTKMAFISAPVLTEDKEFTSVASFELANFFIENDIYMVQAISDNNSGYNLPLIDCQNATAFVPVITFKNSTPSQAIMQDDCIVIEAANSQDYVRLKDKIILEYLGIR